MWGWAERGWSGSSLDGRAPRLRPPIQCWEVSPSAAGHSSTIKGSDDVSPAGARQAQPHNSNNEACARCGVREKNTFARAQWRAVNPGVWRGAMSSDGSSSKMGWVGSSATRAVRAGVDG